MKNFLLGILVVCALAAVPVVSDLSVQQALNHMAQRNLRVVCHGTKVPGLKCVDKFGYNNAVASAAPEDVWSHSSAYVIPTAAYLVSIVSTDDDDQPGDTGARYVEIAGLDANYDEVSEVVALDGTTPVLTTNAMIAINRVIVISAGSSRENEGAITFIQQTSSNVLANIAVGDAITQQLIYTVPNGKQLYLYGADVSVRKLTGSSPQVVFTMEYFDPNLSPALDPTTSGVQVRLFDQKIDTGVVGVDHIPFIVGGAIREHSTIRMQLDTDTNDTQASGRFWGVLEDTE